MIGLAAVIAAMLMQADREQARQGFVPALISVLPMMLAPGLSAMHDLPPLHREWLRTLGALALASLPMLPGRRQMPSRLTAALGAALPGFVLPVIAGYC